MKKVFTLVVAVSALCVATPLFAHHGIGPRGGGYGHDYYDHGYYDNDYYDNGYYNGGGNGCGWCLGSDWCRSQPPGHQHSDRCYFYYDPRVPGQVPPSNTPMPQRPRDVSRAFNGAGVGQGKVAFGTVSSVDKDASTLTLTNADKEDILVHVSPFTVLVLPPKTSAADSTSRVIGPVPPLSVADIPTGSSAMVRAFNTDTKTLEAARVVVMPAS